MKTHLIIGTSLRGMGSVSLTIKNVPDELHQRIIKEYGSYQNMQEDGHPDLYEEFLNLPEVAPFETFNEENE